MKATVAFTSLGCDKNRVDSEVMLGILQKRGYQAIAEEQNADIIVVNTCCFIRDALEESIETIIEMAKYKTEGNCKGLIVAGCLGQRYKDEFFDELPEVDAIIGTASFEEVADVADRILQGEQKFQCMADIQTRMHDENGSLRVLSTAQHTAYLKISEGCDNHCTYCVIPKLRGNHRSRTMESLIEEATILAKQGVKELVIVAQDTSIYGRDLYGSSKLHELLQKLSEIEGIVWIRLLYCYPETLTQETIDVMANNDKICHYIDMPIQHGCDGVLKRMGRKSSQALIRQTVSKLRASMNDITIRTTLIVGFPGETEEDIVELENFISELKFDRLGVFCYSQEEGTPAALLPDQIDDDIKQQRQARIMNIQKSISARKCQDLIGKTVQVLVEGKLPEEDIYCGRTCYDAPDIDGMVFFKSAEEVYSGDFVSVKIKESSDYDVMGDVVYADEFTK